MMTASEKTTAMAGSAVLVPIAAGAVDEAADGASGPKARLGCGAALADRVAAMHTASFGWALCCCRWQREEAEDVLQTVYCKIVEGRARFSGRAQLKTWLFAVIWRTAVERRRRQTCRRLLFDRWCSRDPQSATDRVTAETRLAAGEQRASVRQALEALSERQRQVLELVFFHDHSIRQAAEVLGLRLGTARVHYQRGKQALARRLRKEST